MTGDVMDWLRRQHRAEWHQRPDFMPLGTALRWTIVRNNVVVNEVTTDDGMAGL